MRILLINPPNCGKSIPEERYGITSIRQIFRGEPLALEVLAGNLTGHEVRILDLKAASDGLPDVLDEFGPDLVGLTGVTCEANTVLRLAAEVKQRGAPIVVVGGAHASGDPGFFNRACVDYIAVGLGKASLAELVAEIEAGRSGEQIPGVARTHPGGALTYEPRRFSPLDLAEERPPRYDLVAAYRDLYVLSSLGVKIGFVAAAFGCPFSCSFCCISALTGGRILAQSVSAVVRDIGLLGDLPVVRIVDANAFGDARLARELAQAILDAGIRKRFVVDVRSDTVVRHPDLIRLWKEAGLSSVVIGFEEILDGGLESMNKATRVSVNDEAIAVLHGLGISIVGDFIVSPDYDEARFEALAAYVSDRRIDLPMPSILTPLPGTALHAEMRDRIVIHDLDYYTLTNAVLPTRLGEQRFYELYAQLIRTFHANARV